MTLPDHDPAWPGTSGGHSLLSNTAGDYPMSLYSSPQPTSSLQSIRDRGRVHPLLGCDKFMLKVFAMLVKEEPASGSDWDAPLLYEPHTSRQDPGIGWIKVTHVCRQWRAFALDCSSLWSHIALGLGDRWATEMVTRARSSSLVIETPTDPEFFPEAKLTSVQVVLILQHIHHTKELTIRLDNDSADEIFNGMVVPAPMLEDLHLSRDEAEPQLPLPDMLLGGHTHVLRELRVNGFTTFPWTSGILGASLVHLDITLGIWNEHPITASLAYCETMLDAFERMPALEHLALEWCFNQHDQHTVHSASGRAVQLPSLLHLDIQGVCADECIHAITHLDTPSSPSIRMSVEYHDDFSTDAKDEFVSIVTSALAFHGSESYPATPMKSLHISSEGNRASKLCVEACRHRHHVCRGGVSTMDSAVFSGCTQFALYAEFEFKGHYGDGFHYPVEVAKEIWACVPWASLKRLSVALWANVGLEFPWLGLQEAMHLESLRLHSSFAMSFSRFIAGDLRRQRWLLPALKKIKLFSMTYTNQQQLLGHAVLLHRWREAGVEQGYPRVSVEFINCKTPNGSNLSWRIAEEGPEGTIQLIDHESPDDSDSDDDSDFDDDADMDVDQAMDVD
ncbi:hypothetical protein FA95DRAFT_1678262 [Auriscalpium vulgare]|uniref:Uncharacterized protein n=1 Tax=Auriscalpium vulgare TaxID=40419 RepID=A0ACB8RWF2_9AGAM|nr:hypothetical protein FA95DRAFT_1678262 [Auriscalpium vulgare]